jgi:hypothetical protein
MGSVNIVVPDLHEIHRKLDVHSSALKKILALLEESKAKEIRMTQQLDDLTAAVEENTSLDNSIIQLVDGLAAQILALKDDPAKLAALAASLKASSAAVAAAIAANTPAEPPPPEV